MKDAKKAIEVLRGWDGSVYDEIIEAIEVLIAENKILKEQLYCAKLARHKQAQQYENRLKARMEEMKDAIKTTDG